MGPSWWRCSRPAHAVLRERYLFRSAVYDISLYGYSVLVPVVRISKSPPLRSLITRLFRLTENKLRELMGFRGRLKDVKVDADMDELVTRFLKREFRKAEQAGKGPAVVIDKRKLERLENDSEIVRTLLTIEEPEDSAELEDSENSGDSELDYAVPSFIEEDPIEEIYAVPETLSVPVSPAAASSTDNEWEAFAFVLTPLQRQAVSALADEDGMKAVQKLAAAGGTMPELLFDEINELAMDMLGDLLIDGEELTEEFMPVLQYLKR